MALSSSSSSMLAVLQPSNPRPHLLCFPSHIPNPLRLFPYSASPTRSPWRRRLVRCGIRELRDRICAVKNTQKIAEATKMVAAAKIRRAQEAVINSRPFSEALVDVLYDINERLQSEDVDVPLTAVRPVKKVALLVVSGDRGLCGSFNKAIARKAEARIAKLKDLGLDSTVISVGEKGSAYFRRRPQIRLDKCIGVGRFPTAKQAQAIADAVFSLFVSEEVDKVELIYTKFVSLLRADPIIRTLLPLLPAGGICDAEGNRVDAAEDEVFKLTSRGGRLVVERDGARREPRGWRPLMQFEQEPVQILDALMPLYLNTQILRALQESVASEHAARMNAMSNATENAMELNRNLANAYNRERQAKITSEILEIVAGAEALNNPT